MKIKKEKYSQDDMDKAIEAVRDKKMSLRQAAKAFSVSKSTLFSKFQGRHLGTVGAPTYFDQSVEKQFVTIITFMADIGLGMTKNQIFQIIKNYLNDTKQNYIFENNTPTKKWLENFQRRHPIISNTIHSEQSLKLQSEIFANWFKKGNLIG